ncbi:MAG: hypothetical protein JWO65_675 [Sphingomonas bacterium]|nr:hypothetical protein [Sphingomonas bacterium]
MTERMAQTIYAMAEPPTIGGAPIAWADLPDDDKAPFWKAARHILMVMRAPTPAMLAEGDRRDLPADAANVWERMLFAAMSEQHA